MLFPSIDMSHVGKAWLTLWYIQAFTTSFQLAATSLVELPFSSSCKAFHFFQRNLDVLSICNLRKIEFCGVVKLDKSQQTHKQMLVSAKIKKLNMLYQLK